MQIDTIVQSGHYLQISYTAISPDGSLIATCSPDETVRLWDVAMGCEAAVLKGHTGPVYRICFSPDGQLLASCSWDLTVRLWDIRTRTCKMTIPVPGLPGIMAIEKIVFSPSGKEILSGASSRGKSPGYIHIWDCTTGSAIKHFEIPEDQISALDFSPDGKLVAIAKGDFDFIELRVLEIETGNTALYLKEPFKRTDEELAKPRHYAASVSIAFSADSSLLAFTLRGKVCLVDIKLNKKKDPLPVNDDVYKIQRDPDGRLIAYGQKIVSIWNAGISAQVESFNVSVTCMSYKENIFARANGRTLELVDKYSGQVIRRLGSQLNLPDPGTIGNLMRQFVLTANPVYPILASAAPDGLVRLWDLRKGGAPVTFKAHERSIEGIAFDPGGEILATGGTDKTVKLWAVKNAALLCTILVESSPRSIAFSFNSQFVYVNVDDGRIAVIHTATGTLVHYTDKVNELTSECIIASAPPVEVLVTSQTGIIVCDDVLQQRTPVKIGIPIQSMAYNKERILALGGGNSKWLGMQNPNLVKGQVLLFNTRSGELNVLEGHSAMVKSVAFSPDGKTVVSGGADGKIFLWEAATGQKLFSIDAHAGDVTAVCFISAGFFIASIGLDAVVRLWESSTGKLVATFISLNEDDYVCVTSEGYYTATKPGLRSVMFRVDDNIFPFDQFDLQLNRPDIVLRKLAFGEPELIDAYKNAYERRLKSLGFTMDSVRVEDSDTPQIKLISPQPDPSSSTRLIRLKLSLSSPKKNLNRLLAYCNDVPLYGQQGIGLQQLGRSGEMDVDIQLMSGDNKVQLCVVDESGVSSPMLSFRTVFVNGEHKPGLLILTTGVSKYDDPTYNLEFAAKDAQDLVTEIKKLQQIYAHVTTRVLTDADATRQMILESRAFLENSSIDDHVIVLFAGHGTIVGADYFFLPADFKKEAINASAISYNDIQSLLNGIPARRRLVLLDTCHAGEPDAADETGSNAPLGQGVKHIRSFREIGLDANAPANNETKKPALLGRLPELFADLRRDSGANVIAAAAASEYACEFDELKNGVFTSCVIQAFRDQQLNSKEERITVSALHKYVTKKVEELTGGKQRPVSRRENITDDFPVI